MSHKPTCFLCFPPWVRTTGLPASHSSCTLLIIVYFFPHPGTHQVLSLGFLFYNCLSLFPSRFPRKFLSKSSIVPTHTWKRPLGVSVEKSTKVLAEVGCRLGWQLPTPGSQAGSSRNWGLEGHSCPST